jgi:hypothetical protein
MMATGRKDFLDYSSGHEHERFGAIYQDALGMELLYGGGLSALRAFAQLQ